MKKTLLITENEKKSILKIHIENGYNTISVDSYYNHLKAGTPLPEKTIMITFDDVYAGQYRYAMPILRKYNFTATFYIPAWNVDMGKSTSPYGDIMRL